MDSVSRVIRWALLALAFAVSSHVHAAAPVRMAAAANSGIPNGGPYYATTAAGACAAFWSGAGAARWGPYGWVDGGPRPVDVPEGQQFDCWAKNSNGDWINPVAVGSWEYRCPGGTAPDMSKPFAEQCSAPVTCQANSVLGSDGSKWYWKGKGSTTCQQGCLYIADQFAYDKNSGYSVGWGRLNGLGAPCTAGQESVSGTPPENKPPNTCEAGKCPGTVNGVAVCVKCGSGGSVEKKTETTTKDSGDGGQSDQTTTKTEKKTICEDGKCVTETTTTTTSSSGGTKSETAKEEQSQDSFCSKNPDHALCKEQKSEFSGGCASGFRCEGDAVQCAMAREQHERMCQLLDNETDLSKIGNRIGTGQDDQDTKNRLGNGDSPIDISTGFASAQPVGPTSGCPADVSVGQWTIPFSRMCPHLNTLGNALVGLAYLVGALIVFRRGGSD